MEIIITSPSLDPSKNVSGVSSVTQFIINNNTEHDYIHFELGRKDGEKGGIHRVGAILQALSRWNKLLKEHPQAAIHYNFPLEKPSILRDPLFMQIAHWRGRRMTIHLHGGVFLSASHIPFPFKQILRHVFHWQTPVITLSEKESQTVEKMFGAKHVHTLPNCVDLRDAQNYNRPIKPESSPLVLGYLGRIAETKGMDYLLQACVSLKESATPFLLKIAGAEEVEDKYLPLFKERLGENFEYCGLVSGEKKKTFLQSLDVFVLPTYFEGLPMSLLECMSYGIVPVVTPVGSIPSVVKNKENGLFIKDHDAETIIEKVTFLHQQRAELQKLGEQAKKTVFSNFSPSQYVAKLNTIYPLDDCPSKQS